VHLLAQISVGGVYETDVSIRYCARLVGPAGRASFAQSTQDKKSYTFHGEVEAVDADGKSLKVNGEEV
jgi:hypothetical protein